MSRMKDLAISLRNGDQLSDAERDYVSTLTPQELASARGQDNTYEEYQDEMYWGPTTERVIREFGSYEAYRKWLDAEAEKRR